LHELAGDARRRVERAAVEPGEKRIRVTMDGYKSSERSVMVDEGAQETVRIRLVESGL